MFYSGSAAAEGIKMKANMPKHPETDKKQTETAKKPKLTKNMPKLTTKEIIR